MATSEDTPLTPHLRIRSRPHKLLNLFIFLIAVYTLLELAMPRSIVFSVSMQPNLVEGQRLVISRVSYMFTQPQRGEIIVLEPDDNTINEDRLIKRVIGLPSETIECHNQVVLNIGHILDETYTNELCEKTMCPDKLWKLDKDEYFVMGDNRNHSRDSRMFGPIKRNQIVGRAIIRWWTPTQWGILAYNYGASGSSSPCTIQKEELC